MSRSKLARHVYLRHLAACHHPENTRPSLCLVESFLKFHTLKNIENIATTRKEMHVHFRFFNKNCVPYAPHHFTTDSNSETTSFTKANKQMRVTSRPFETCLLARKNSERAKKKNQNCENHEIQRKARDPWF